ncbi:uncharacterized protein LOC121422318 isoform X1 [Lytechinus variegatus]|uniref:uncharacterized protein LOC121422318 isoform X1 n=1 Tax=Lytechinus variegatus TaxID=7654 RepID=UPI001BB23982|nr:uncharacterized protein LOC121422318 isoform X1 [Lytechinus variegatus]XP_041473212.1 uncharacterized protein LOC121422318 isoform X1 [Lytechinus variegatus]XP_041473213.1 uncharacterized protein LOC121422318 isoform X1 [Lytechinus variegatus]
METHSPATVSVPPECVRRFEWEDKEETITVLIPEVPSTNEIQLPNTPPVPPCISAVDHTYAYSPGSTKRKLEFALHIEKAKKRKAQMESVNKSMKIRSLKDLKTTLENYGVKKSVIETTLDEIPGDSYDLLVNNEEKNRGRNSGRRYSPELLNLCLTLHYLSPKCYKYLRTIFSIPSDVTLRKMLASVDGKPGFTEESINTLKYINESSSRKLHWSLMLDAMSIKKQIQYDKINDVNNGFTSIGNAKCEGETPTPATQALVFMIVAMNCHIKLTVGYFFINKLSASLQAALIQECLIRLYENGIQVDAIVCDGAAVNKSTMSMLGTSLDPKNLKGEFPHPANGHPVTYIPDVCHNLKLLRNLLGEKEELIFNGTEKVHWNHIKKAYEIQQKEGMRAANKLTAEHINFSKSKMKVK